MQSKLTQREQEVLKNKGYKQTLEVASPEGIEEWQKTPEERVRFKEPTTEYPSTAGIFVFTLNEQGAILSSNEQYFLTTQEVLDAI